MVTQRIYTSTVSTPIYASWKCEKCGEVNIATGAIACERSVSTSSIRQSKQSEARYDAEKSAREAWLENAYAIIAKPDENGAAMFNSLAFKDIKCRKCGKKPRWYKTKSYARFLQFAAVVAMMSGVLALAVKTSAVLWVIFALSAGFLVWILTRESAHASMMKKLPKEYVPVIGSLNKELLAYAAEHNTKIPTPDEAVLEASRRGRIQSSTM